MDPDGAIEREWWDGVDKGRELRGGRRRGCKLMVPLLTKGKVLFAIFNGSSSENW
jgi:hypothetical protein